MTSIYEVVGAYSNAESSATHGRLLKEFYNIVRNAMESFDRVDKRIMETTRVTQHAAGLHLIAAPWGDLIDISCPSTPRKFSWTLWSSLVTSSTQCFSCQPWTKSRQNQSQLNQRAKPEQTIQGEASTDRGRVYAG